MHGLFAYVIVDRFVLTCAFASDLPSLLSPSRVCLLDERAIEI